MKLHNIYLVLKKYNIEGELCCAKKYGYGNINRTTKLTILNEGKKSEYILQQINKKLFNVKQLMFNIEQISNHLRVKSLEKGENCDRQVLSIVYSKKNKSYVKVKKEYYRIYKFISNSVCLQHTNDCEIFEKAGFAFGEFQNKLSDFDATKLYDVLPDFHNTNKRFQDFKKALKNNQDKLKDKNVKRLINELLIRENYINILVEKENSGVLPKRVVHNDTKLNNIVFDKKTKQPLAILDFDTIQCSTLLYDYGDAIRYGCNTAKEDEKNIKKINFDFKLFKAFTKGFLKALIYTITKEELDNLVVSVLVITFELTLRFLTDYLNNNKYFRVKYEKHNFVRAKAQFELLKKFEQNKSKMTKEIYKIANSLVVNQEIN